MKVSSQVVEAGVHAGYSFSKFTLDQNRLNDQVFVKAGKPFSGFTFGIQVLVSPPKLQSTTSFRIVPSLLLEASVCRCGGNIELSLTTPNGVRTFNELSYLIYRGEYSAKFVAGIKGLQLMLGPMITNQFYTSVKIGASEGSQYAGDQFKALALGYEFGVSTKLNRVHLSMRYNRIIGAYGKKTDLIPTAYKHFQIRFMLHYYFLQKNKGKNWGSIYWD
ncbi:MAG: hypothetical protein JKY48_19905 [Flavobacteriales bacterium]|nr:hypothetical protein [Flavobacteriales bacterium]